MIEIEPVYAWSIDQRELPQAVAAQLAATGAVKVIPLAGERWQIETNSRVGILVGDGWELRIRPHLKISKLLFLLAYSLNPNGWQDAVTGMARESDIVDALASGFCAHATQALEHGLLRGYVAVEERRNDLRGRVRFADQLARMAGLAVPLEVSYDEYTADIAENQLLRTVTETLLSLVRVSTRARTRLFHLRAVLDEASLISDHRGVLLPPITRLNQRYEAALVLAKLILDGKSLRQESGAIITSSFLFDMNEVFESFVFIALREALRPYGGVALRQAKGSLDEADPPGLPLVSDILWRRNGVVRAVIDSKYKPLFAEGGLPYGDAYQMLAYCVGFAVRRGLLIYARDSTRHPRRHRIKRHGYEIEVRALDIEREPEEILQTLGQIAAAVAAWPAPLQAPVLERR